MTRWTLTNTIIGPAAEILLQVSGARMARDIDRAGYNFNASSLTEQAYQWAHTLNHLTHRNNLQLCTLLPLKNLVSGFVLLSEKQRFCPAGYADDAVAGRGFYDRLLWSIDAVKACPLHRLQLVNRSEAKRRSVSDWGGVAPSQEAEAARRVAAAAAHRPASDYEVDSSRLIAELLDDAVVLSDAGYSASAQAAFLTHAIDVLSQGTSAHFAAHLDVSKSQMHGWAHGDVRMSFPPTGADRLLLRLRNCRHLAWKPSDAFAAACTTRPTPSVG
jgi:hypothetical protein